jgi:hypothetical protein
VTVAVDSNAQPRAYTFDHIPILRELLPKQHGRPGLIYAQVHVANLRRAQDQGWREIDGTAAYTIVGPKGHIDMKLMGKGKPIAGIGHASGKRRCVYDLDIEERTGLLVKSKPLNVNGAESANGGTTSAGRPVESKPQATGPREVESRKGDARVQARDSAQR